MFTGIIQAVGQIAASEERGGDRRLRIHTGKLDLSDCVLGDSIAVNGVCLTAVAYGADSFSADVSVETLNCTSLGDLAVGSPANLEKAVTPNTRLGGHFVSGHVDGLGTVLSRREAGRAWQFRVEAPVELARYIAAKGSICVDGTSLTVNAVDGPVFDLTIVPHTLEETIIGNYQSGTRVNLEVDIIARYLERLLLADGAAARGGGLSLDLLKERGFTSE